MSKQQFLDHEGLNVLINEIIGDTIQSLSISAGTNNGTIKLTIDGTVHDNIPVKGLGSAAYESKGSFAASSPIFTPAAALANIISGENISVMLGKISKSITDFILHKGDTVTHITAGERTNWNDSNNKKHSHSNKNIIDTITQPMLDKLDKISAGAEVNVQSDWNVSDTSSDAYIKNKPASLPANGGNSATVNGHTVESNVPATAKFTDTVYNHPTSGATAGTYRSVTVNGQGHVTTGTNPTTLSGYGITDAAAKTHTHAKSQVGLGNVPNVATNDQTPTFTQASTLSTLTSGEKLNISFGKIMKAISDFITHKADSTVHITTGERTKWNGKVDSSSGDIADTKISSLTESTDSFPIPAAGETSKVFMGKIRKNLEDWKAFKDGIITVGKLMNNGTTTASGYALDARYGKTLYDLYAQLNSNFVNAKNITISDANYEDSSLLQMISAHWSEIENGYGLIKLLNRSNHYSGYYIKYNALSGSILFTSAAGAMRLWTTNNNIATITDYTNLMSTIWLFDIAATDTAEHEIDPTGVRLIIVMLNYNSFTAYGIYTTGMMSDTRTKVISVSPTKEYYCNARIVTSVTGGKLKIRLSGLDRHSNTVSANLSIYYAK